MARLPALVEAIAAHDDRSITLINQYARVLRESELIVSDRSGLGAPMMTVDDATTLLMAVLGGATPAAGPEAVHRLRQLRPAIAPRLKTDHPLDEIHGHSFERALRYCIENAAVIRTWAAGYRPKPKGDWFEDAPWSRITGDAPRTRLLNVAVYNGGAFAELSLGGGRQTGGLFDHIYMIEGAQIVFPSGYGARGAGLDLIVALKAAVDAPVPARTWKRQQPNN